MVRVATVLAPGRSTVAPCWSGRSGISCWTRQRHASPGPSQTIHSSCRTTPDHTRLMPDQTRMNMDYFGPNTVHPGTNTIAIRMRKLSMDCPGPARMNTVTLQINTVTLRIVPKETRTTPDKNGSLRTWVRNDIKGMRFHIKIISVFDSTTVTMAEMSLRLQLMWLQLQLTQQQNENTILVARARKLTDKKRRQKFEKEAKQISNRKRRSLWVRRWLTRRPSLWQYAYAGCKRSCNASRDESTSNTRITGRRSHRGWSWRLHFAISQPGLCCLAAGDNNHSLMYGFRVAHNTLYLVLLGSWKHHIIKYIVSHIIIQETSKTWSYCYVIKNIVYNKWQLLKWNYFHYTYIVDLDVHWFNWSVLVIGILFNNKNAPNDVV